MLEFLVLILLPNKGAWVTVGVASTILGCFANQSTIDWGLVFADHVRKMVSGVDSTKPSGLSPFIFHLYKATECLDEEEVRYYKATEVEEAYGFEDSDEESKEGGAEETRAVGAGPSEPAPSEQVTPEPKKTKRKTTPRST